MSVASEIYEIVQESVADKRPGQVRTVRVAVGELSAVEPELLIYAWEAMTRGGQDEGSQMKIDWHPARQYCEQCAEEKERESGRWIPLCPDCLQPLRIDGGRELDIVEVTFHQEEGTQDAPTS